MMELTIFNYKTNKVRVVMKNGEPRWVLKDLCDTLKLSNARMIADRLDEDDVSLAYVTDSTGRQQQTNVVNESGLYDVILRSDKAEAKEFKRWITHEVLPQIRKTGSYIKIPQTYIQALESLIETEREKERLTLENSDLQIELDESKKYYTIKRVASMNEIYWKRLDWQRLKRTSQAMEYEVKRIFDANYGNVNSYHIAVWKREYPELVYGE
jgi:prophage antirepressor-like protein